MIRIANIVGHIRDPANESAQSEQTAAAELRRDFDVGILHQLVLQNVPGQDFAEKAETEIF